MRKKNFNGKATKQIFKKCSFDVETLGLIRIKATGKRLHRTFKEEGIFGLDDGRKLVNKKTVNKNLRDDILTAYKFKHRKKCARQIKITLECQFNITNNLNG